MTLPSSYISLTSTPYLPVVQSVMRVFVDLTYIFGGELTYPNEQASIPGTQTCVPSSYISLTSTPYLPVIHSVMWISQRIFQRHLTQRKRMCMPFEWIGTKWKHAAEECRNVVAMMLSTHRLTITLGGMHLVT